MNSQQDELLPYVIAGVSSICFLTCLPMFLYFVMLYALNDIGGPLNLILIPCSNLIVAVILTLVVFFPLSKLLGYLFLKIDKNKQPRINPYLYSALLLVFFLVIIIGVFSITIGIMLETPFALQLLDTQDVDTVVISLIRFLFFGGIPFLLGGALYWFILQTYQKFFSKEQKSDSYLKDGSHLFMNKLQD